MGVSAERVLRRYAKEFSTPKELQKYLRDHPQADKTKHSVHKSEPKAPGMTGTRAKDIVPKRHESEGADGKAESKDKPKPKSDKKDARPEKGSALSRWKAIGKGLSDAAVSFVQTSKKEFKTFISDPESRKKTLASASDTLKKSPKILATSLLEAAKEEVHEFKTAGQGIAKVLKGGKMNKHQKHAFKKVATHLAIGATAAAFTATTAFAGAAVFAKGLGRAIALKAVNRSLEKIHTLDELSHIGHGVTHLLHHVAAEGGHDPDKFMVDFVTAAVAHEIDHLSDEDISSALNGAAEKGDSKRK